MSRPVALDTVENEQPIQTTQSTASEHLCASVQKDCQAQTLTEVPQTVANQADSAHQGPLPASQRHLPSQQQNGNGSKPEQKRYKKFKRQYVCDQTCQQLAPLPFGSCVPSTDGHAGRAAPPIHITSTNAAMDPPVSAADPSTDDLLPSASSLSQCSAHTAPACGGAPCLTPPFCHRTQQQDSLPSCHREHQEDSLPACHRAQQGDTQSSCDRAQQGNTLPSCDRAQQGDTQSSCDRAQQGNTLPSCDRAQQGNTLPSCDRPQQRDAQPSCDRPQQRDTLPSCHTPQQGNTPSSYHRSNRRDCPSSHHRTQQRDTPPSRYRANQRNPPYSSHTAQQRHRYSTTDTHFTNTLRVEERVNCSPREGARCSHKKRSESFTAQTDLEPSITIRPDSAAHKMSESSFKKGSQFIDAEEFVYFKRGSATFSAGKSSVPSVEKQSEPSGNGGSEPPRGKGPDSSATSRTASYEHEARRLGVTPPKRSEERANSQIHPTSSNTDQTTGCHFTCIGMSPDSEGKWEGSQCAYKCSSIKSRSKRKGKDTVSRGTNASKPSDSTERGKRDSSLQIQCGHSRPTSRRKKTGSRCSANSGNLFDRRAVTRDINAEIHSASHHENHKGTLCVRSESHCCPKSTAAVCATPTVLHYASTCTSGWSGSVVSAMQTASGCSGSVVSARQTASGWSGSVVNGRQTASGCSESVVSAKQAGHNKERKGGKTRNVRKKRKGSEGDAGGTKEVFRRLTTSFTTSPLSPTSVATQTCVHVPHEGCLNSQVTGIAMDTDSWCGDHAQVQIKAETVDRGYLHFQDNVGQDRVTQTVLSTLHTWPRGTNPRGTSAEGHEENVPPKPSMGQEWSIVFEAPLPIDSHCSTTWQTSTDSDTRRGDIDKDMKEHSDKDVKKESHKNVKEPVNTAVKEDTDRDVKHEIDKDVNESIDRDVKHEIDKDVNESIDRDVEHEIDKDVNESIDRDVKHEINKDVNESIDRDVKHEIDKDVNESIDRDVEHEIDKDVKENGDKGVKQEIDKDVEETIDKDVKKNADKERREDTGIVMKEEIGKSTARLWSQLSREQFSPLGILKTFKKNAMEGEENNKEDNESTIRLISKSFESDHPRNTVQTTGLSSLHGCMTSTYQKTGGRRKQKTPRQFQKQSVLQSKFLGKKESIQTERGDCKVLDQCFPGTYYPPVLEQNCHVHHPPNRRVLQLRTCLQVPSTVQAPVPPTPNKQSVKSERFSSDDVSEPIPFPKNVSVCCGSESDSHCCCQSVQTLKNCTNKFGTSRSGNNNVSAYPVTSVISSTGTTLTVNKKVWAQNCKGAERPFEHKSQAALLSRVDLLSKETETGEKEKVSEQVQQNYSQYFSSSSPAVSVQTSTLPVVRLPYVPLPLCSPTTPAMIPALSRYQTPSSTSVPVVTTARLKTLHQPSYIPIVPKIPVMLPAVQTTLPALGTLQVTPAVAKGASSPVGVQTVPSGYNTNLISVQHLQQMGEANSKLMQGGLPQSGVVQHQMFSACAGSIPVLIFWPNMDQNLSPGQTQAERVSVAGLMTPTAREKANKQQEFPDNAKVSDDRFSAPDNISNHVGKKSDETQKLNVHPHESTVPTEANSSKEESILRTSDDPSNVTATPLPCSKINVATTLANTSSPSENRIETLTVLKSDTKGASTSSHFPFQYDARKRAEEIVFSTTFHAPSENDVNGTSKQASSVTCMNVPCQDEYPKTSPQALSAAVEETSKPVPPSKSGRKRTASTRYDFQSDIELTDASDAENLTPITSDEEWTPEKDEEQSAQSSEEEDYGRKSRRRDSMVDLFKLSKRRKVRKESTAGQNLTANSMRKDAKTSSATFVYSSTRKQPQEDTQVISTVSDTPELDKADRSLTGTGSLFSRKNTDQQNDFQEESKPCKSPKTSPVNIPVNLPIHAPKKRRRTPYTKEELTCRLCSKTFINIYRLKRHEFSHGNERPFVCDLCGKAFKQSGHRNEHRLTHSANKRSFLCNVCGVVINSRSSFRYHLLSHKQCLSGTVCTASCEIVVPTNSTKDLPHSLGPEAHSHHQPSQMSAVLAITDKEDSSAVDADLAAAYDCPHCGQRFATAQSLNCHLETHPEVEARCHVQPFICPECGRSFTYRHNLEKHRHSHVKPEKRADSYQRKVQAEIAAGKPHFVCDTCGKVYLRKETLTKHMKTHLGLKPYQCIECLKSFTQKIHLTVHSRLHTGSRPFQCRSCRCCFLDSTALARHVMRDVCKSEGFAFNVGKRGRKPFHVVVSSSVKAIVKANRERRSSKAPEAVKCGQCSWTGKHPGSLRRHVQRCHSARSRQALKDSIQISSTDNGITAVETSLAAPQHHKVRDSNQQGVSLLPTPPTTSVSPAPTSVSLTHTSVSPPPISDSLPRSPTSVSLPHSNVSIPHTSVSPSHTSISLPHNNISLPHTSVSPSPTNVSLPVPSTHVSSPSTSVSPPPTSVSPPPPVSPHPLVSPPLTSVSSPPTSVSPPPTSVSITH